MKKLIQTTAALLVLGAASASAEESMKQFKVWAVDFSDGGLEAAVDAGDSCAAWLKYLQSPQERYVTRSVAGMQGPPGVVYTLTNNRGDVAILKCGTSGSHGDEGGGGH
jgi:hypothetical protein